MPVWSVDEANELDIPSWLEVVREVEPLFGPMPDFDETLTRNIARRTAFCVHDGNGMVLGGTLLRRLPNAQIAWLAVRSTSRGQGVGSALITEALRRYAKASEVVVETFGEDNPQGRSARRLYEAFGFVGCEHLQAGAEGGTRQLFRRNARGNNSPTADNRDLARIQSICQRFPECQESQLQDRPLFRARTRRFAIFNGSASPPRRRWEDFGRSLHFVTDPQEQNALRQDVRLAISPHHGDRGWMAIDLERREVDWGEVAELLETAFRQVAARQLVERLDASSKSRR